MGGTGKTPLLSRLANDLVQQGVRPAILTRGYGEDEIFLMREKCPGVPLGVGPHRIEKAHEVLASNQVDVFLLDDGFQHWPLQRQLDIVCVDAAAPFEEELLLPAGRLREWKYGYRRADIIVVTKCPPDLNIRQRQEMLMEIDPFPRQRVYFSSYRYTTPFDLLRPDLKRNLDLETDVLLVSAIANTDYLLQHLGQEVHSVQTIEFEDHHFFNDDDLEEILRKFNAMPSRNKIILTTEKDAVRLEMHHINLWQNKLPVYVLPIEVTFLEKDEADFQADVQQFLLDFKS